MEKSKKILKVEKFKKRHITQLPEQEKSLLILF